MLSKRNIKIILLFFSHLCLFVTFHLPASTQNLTKYVNPFIGTANNDNTYPNAVAPNGMISVGAQNVDFENMPPFQAVSYIHGGDKFYGVSHTNLSGVGCPDMGSLILFPQQDSISFNNLKTGVPFRNENAEPGFYECLINEHIHFRTTVSVRSAIEEFTFVNQKENYLILNLGRSLSKAKGANIRVINNKEIAGYKMEGRFCNRSPERKLFFVIRFFDLPKAIQLFEEGKQKAFSIKQIAGSNIGVVIQFVRKQRVLLKVGISYVSEANARKNLEKEIPNWDFQMAQHNVTGNWESVLSKIQVTGSSRDDKIKFYTALYHVLLHPNIINDVNQDYPLMGNQQGTGKIISGNRFTVLSLWDTYRNVHPLLTLVYPSLQQQILRTMVDMYKESGQLPKWEVGSGESYTMVGDPAAIVIADSYLKGIKNFDIATAYSAMLKQASVTRNINHIRPGYKSYLKYGYIPNDDKGDDYVWGSVSTSLEYNLADWCISRVVKKLGDFKNERLFLKRSSGYQNFYDSTYKLLRPKLSDNSWLPGFDPLDSFKELGWNPSGGIGFVEGNSWQYTWFVPHDMKGLVRLMGGPGIFTKQLQKCFDSSYFVLSNEPDMAYPWLFNYVKGEEWRTKKIVMECINKYFGVEANGLPGNDDCGTMSAWLVFAMIGFYPDCPGSINYQTALPVFDKIEIELDDNYLKKKKLIIEKKNNSMWINGIKVGPTITHSQLTEY